MQVSLLPAVEITCPTVIPHLPLLAVPPRLDIVTSDALLATCQCFLATRPHPKALILDFAQTRAVDSCGIGTLKTIAGLASELDLPVVAWSVAPHIAQTLHAAQLDSEIAMDTRTRAVIDPFCDRSQPQTDNQAHASTTSFLKRAIDIVGALVGLSLTALLFLPIAIAIQLDSPGPILFSQIRRGLLGRRIRIWKFRSMVVDAEARKDEVKNQIDGAFFKNDRDPRITRIGQFLRRTSLDELPQFWCVLVGTMSLIGTRPPTEDEVAQYTIADWQRLNVKPGLSGEWQVCGRSSIQTFREVVALDLAYQRKWSIGYDLKLILQTLAVVFSRRSGAC